MTEPRGRVVSSASDLFDLLPDNSAGLVVTDPPWRLQGGGRFAECADYELMDMEDVADVLDKARRVLVDGAHMYVFAPASAWSVRFGCLMERSGWELLRLLAWHKGAAAGLGAYRNAWEPVLVFSNGASRGFKGTSSRYPSWLSFPPPGGRTSKPWELYSRFVDMSSEPGELVVDPFCGTNPLGKAMRRLHRSGDWLAGDVLTAQEVADSLRSRPWREAGGIGQKERLNRPPESGLVQERLTEGV